MSFKAYLQEQQLDEISSDLLKRYVDAARKNKDGVVEYEKSLPNNSPERNETDKKIMKRFRGINKATTKLHKKETDNTSSQFYEFDPFKKRKVHRR